MEEERSDFNIYFKSIKLILTAYINITDKLKSTKTVLHKKDLAENDIYA